jgi:creatinine amidohydrolase
MRDADDPDRTSDLVFRYTAPALSTNGVTGRPSQASALLGDRLLTLTAEALADRVRRGRKEEPPLGQALPPRI